MEKPDPSIFSTESNPEGIQVGTAIALLVRRALDNVAQPPPAVEAFDEVEDRPQPGAAVPHKHGEAQALVRFRHLWGRRKREELLQTADNDGTSLYEALSPPVQIGYPLMPVTVEADYLTWPKLPELMPVSFAGVKTSRDEFLVDIDREKLEERLADYFNPGLTHEEIAARYPSVMQDAARYRARPVRDQLLRRGLQPGSIIAYCYRPFDMRWLYWEPLTKLLDEKRTHYFQALQTGAQWLGATQRNRRNVFYSPIVTSAISDHHVFESNVAMFPSIAASIPLSLSSTTMVRSLFESESLPPNRSYGVDLYFYRTWPTGNTPDTATLFRHVLAVIEAPLTKNITGGPFARTGLAFRCRTERSGWPHRRLWVIRLLRCSTRSRPCPA